MANIKNKVYIKPSVTGELAALTTLTDDVAVSDIQFSDDPDITNLLHPVLEGDNVTADGIFQILKDLIYNDNLFADQRDAASEAISEGVFDLARSTLTSDQEAELILLAADRDAGDGTTWLHVDNNNTPYTTSEQLIALTRLTYLIIKKYYCSFNISAERISAYAGFYGTFDLPDIESVPASFTGVVEDSAITVAADNSDINTTGSKGNTSFYGDGVNTLADKLASLAPKVYLIYPTYIGTPDGCATEVTIISKTSAEVSEILTFNGTTDTIESIATNHTIIGDATQVPTAGNITLTADTSQIVTNNAEIIIEDGEDTIFVDSVSTIVSALNSGTLYNQTITGDGVQTVDQLINRLNYARYLGTPDGCTTEIMIVEDTIGGISVDITGHDDLTITQLLAETGRTFNVLGDASQIIADGETITIVISATELYEFDVASTKEQILKLDSEIEITDGTVLDSIYDDFPNVVNKILVGPGKVKIYEEDEYSDSVYFVRNENEADDDDPIESPADGTFYVEKVLIDGYYRRDLISVVFRDTENVDNKTLPYLKYEYGTPSSQVSTRHNISANKILTDTFGSYPLWSILYKRSGNITWALKLDQIFQWAGLSSLVSFDNVTPYLRVNESFAVHTSEDIPLLNYNGENLAIDYGESAKANEDQVTGDSHDLAKGDAVFISIPTDLDAISENDSIATTFPYIITEAYNDYLTYDSVEVRSLDIIVQQLSDYTGYEGIEANIYTLPRFATSANNSEVVIKGISIVNGKHKLTINDAITNYIQTTNDGTEYTESRSPMQGDIIVITDGKGKGQIATINSIGVVETYTEIFLTGTLLNPVPEIDTSKLMIFKSDEETQVGFDLTDTFLDGLDADEKIDYNTQYYPYDSTLPDRHSGVSRLPYSSISFFRGMVNLADASRDYVEILAQTSGSANDSFITGDGVTDVDTLVAAIPDKLFTVTTGGSLIPASGEIVIITGGKLWENENSGNQLLDQLTYAETVPDELKTYDGEATIISFPFKIRLNINQYYFVKICVARKSGTSVTYSTTINTAVTDNTNTAIETRFPYFTSIYNKNAGLYPGITSEGEDFFRIFHKYSLVGTYELKDIENQETAVVAQRISTETEYGSTIFLPPYWKPVAKNLDSVLTAEELYPPARALNLVDPEVRKYDVDAPGIVYVDTQSGKIMFHPDDQPDQDDIRITFTKNNVVTGKTDTESILHITDPETNPKTVTLRSILESFQTQIDEDALEVDANSMVGNAESSRTAAQDIFVPVSSFIVRSSVGNIQTREFTDLALDLVNQETTDGMQDILDIKKVYEYTDFASFPALGVNGNLYIDTTTSLIYRWDTTGAEYVQISTDISVLEYADEDSFPATGASSILYIAQDTGGVFRWDGTEYIAIGGGGGTTKDIEQVAHGFFVGQVLRPEAGSYVLALADEVDNLGLFIVSSVYDVDNFTIMQMGYLLADEDLSSVLESGDASFTADTWYYLSETEAGKLTSTKPLFPQRMLFAISTTEAYVIGYRPEAAAFYKTDELTYVLGQSTYTLSHKVDSKESLLLIVEGVPQSNADYDVDTYTLTLNTVYPDGVEIRAWYISTLNYEPAGAAMEEFKELLTTDKDTFTLTNLPISPRHVIASINGQVMDSDDYSISGYDLIFDDTIPTGAKVRILNIYAARLLGMTAENTADNSIPASKIIDGTGTGLDADLLDGKDAGNASGNIPISNGTVCTNLNADLLDGKNTETTLTDSDSFIPTSAAVKAYTNTKIYISTSDPSGGVDKDVWYKIE